MSNLLDEPIYLGEQKLNLSNAILTSGGVTSPQLAIDDEPTTCAVFSAFTESSTTTWPSIFVTSAGFVTPQGYPTVDEWPFVYIDSVGNPVWERREEQGTPSTINVLSYDTVIRRWVITGSQTAPGTNSGILYEDNGTGSLASGPSSPTAWNIVSGSGPAPVVTGGVPVIVVDSSPKRFIALDWGTEQNDRWICRIRLKQNINTFISYSGITFKSSFGYIEGGDVEPEPEIPFQAYIPLPSGNGIYDLTFDPPVLARGLVFYPDYYDPNFSTEESSGTLPEVDLYQLQVYENIYWQEGLFNVMSIIGPIPQAEHATVGCSSVTIYPWLRGSSYPFAAASAVGVFAIQGLDFDMKMSNAEVWGGDSVHRQGSYETKRDITGRITFEEADFRVFSLFLGDQVIIDAANATNGENQYATTNINSQAPYFSIVAQSTKGDPAEALVFPKCKVTGFTRNLQTDKTTDYEISYVYNLDRSYIRQDGVVGGVYELVFNDGGTPLRPS